MEIVVAIMCEQCYHSEIKKVKFLSNFFFITTSLQRLQDALDALVVE